MADSPDKRLFEEACPAAKREVLRVLWDSPDEVLVRSEIYRRMSLHQRPTLGRVGQLLKELKAEDYVVTTIQKAQGSREAAFYKLSPSGTAVCLGLGFRRREPSLFPATEEEQKSILTRDGLQRRSAIEKPITAFYGYHGGLGRTTAIAHAVRGMAEMLDRATVLAVDLDLSTPGLDRFFEPPIHCKGLAGLVVDYQRQAPAKRALWLLGAVMADEYVHRLPDAPNLAFMPSGLSPGRGALSATEHAEAMALLQAETKPAAPGGFLRGLREAIKGRYARALLDAQAGRTLSAWVATQALADHLVVWLRPTDTDMSTIDGLRSVLATFLRRPHTDVLFAFSVRNTVPAAELNRWIDDYLVCDRESSADLPDYEAQVLLHDWRPPAGSSQRSGEWRYRSLTAWLAGAPCAARQQMPELELLELVLNPTKSWHWRDLAAGVLSNLPPREWGRLLESYEADPRLPRETDDLGHRLIDNIIRGHERRIRSTLPSRNTDRGRGGSRS